MLSPMGTNTSHFASDSMESKEVAYVVFVEISRCFAFSSCFFLCKKQQSLRKRYNFVNSLWSAYLHGSGVFLGNRLLSSEGEHKSRFESNTPI